MFIYFIVSDGLLFLLTVILTIYRRAGMIDDPEIECQITYSTIHFYVVCILYCV